jgi:hypothetical protein
MNKEEANIFLESKLLLQIGTIDDKGILIFNLCGLTTIRTETNF